jgi:hypothetical protein
MSWRNASGWRCAAVINGFNSAAAGLVAAPPPPELAGAL